MVKVEKCSKCGTYYNADAFDMCPYCIENTEPWIDDSPAEIEDEHGSTETKSKRSSGVDTENGNGGKTAERDSAGKGKSKPKPKDHLLRICMLIIALGCICLAIVFGVKTIKKPGIEILTQPADYTGIVGGTAEFTVKAKGKDLQYLWEFTDDGVKWKTSSNTEETAICHLKEKRNGRQYRCTISDSAGNEVVSRYVTITIATIEITEQPVDFEGPEDTDATFTVKASGEELRYAWQFSNDGGKTWKVSSSKDATVSCPITESRDGRLYCCVISDKYGNVVLSNVAKLTMQKQH